MNALERGVLIMQFVSAEAQYNTMQAGITSGIALAVLVPIACIIICVIQRFRGGDDKDEGDMEFRVRQAPSKERL